MSTPAVSTDDAVEQPSQEAGESAGSEGADDRDEVDTDDSGDGGDTTSSPPGTPKRRKRVVRTYPASSFKEALPVAEAIQKFAAGQRVRRLTLFEHMGRSVDSGASRQLITNSAQYGLTKGSYSSEFLELTDKGKLASGDDSLGRARLAARLQLAIADVVPFSGIYEQFKNNRIPASNVIRDFVVEQSLASEEAGRVRLSGGLSLRCDDQLSLV